MAWKDALYVRDGDLWRPRVRRPGFNALLTGSSSASGTPDRADVGGVGAPSPLEGRSSAARGR